MLVPFQTNINHYVKQSLKLSFEEYVVVDAINFICSYRKNESGTAAGKYREVIASSMDISPRSVDRAILSLAKKGLIRQVTRQSVEITALWQEVLSYKPNSRQNGVSEENTTHAILAQESRHNGVSANLLYIHKKHKICPKPMFLTNFRLSFLKDFSILGFSSAMETPIKIAKSAAAASIEPKKSQKGGGAGAMEERQRGFEEFWRIYPRREGKKAAVAAWGRLYPKKSQIMGALASYMADLEAKNTGKQYIKFPATFLNCYEDYLPEEGATPIKTLLDAGSSGGVGVSSGGSVYEDSKEFDKALALLRVVAAALAAGRVSAQNSKANAFEFVDTASGARIFSDRAAIWIEDMGGLAKVATRYQEFDFEEKALGVWLNSTAAAS